MTNGVEFLSRSLLDPGDNTPLYVQLQKRIRELIVTGVVSEGTRLPSTRKLATDLSLSRTTVLGAYDALRAEGLIVQRPGAGTIVAAHTSTGTTRKKHSKKEPAAVRLSNRGNFAVESPGPATNRSAPFQLGVPSLGEVPLKIWHSLVTRLSKEVTSRDLDHGDPLGYRPLRESIAQHLATNRAVYCTADTVVVFPGTMYVVDMAARLLADEGDGVLFEDPGYTRARRVLQAAGLRTQPVPVDEQGMQVTRRDRSKPPARLAYVTPSRQFPLGVTMPVARRKALLDWSVETDGWIVEDDYDNEFYTSSHETPSIQGLAPDSRVVYAGTFSQSLFPSLRVSYAVVPKGLVSAFSEMRTLLDGHSNTFNQMVLSAFIDEGHYGAHVRKMRQRYGERREELISLVNEKAGEFLDVQRGNGGMHVVVHLRKGISAEEVAREGSTLGLVLPQLARYYQTETAANGLLLGFASASSYELRKATDKLVSVLKRCSRS